MSRVFLIAAVTAALASAGLVQDDGTIKAAGSSGTLCAENRRGMVRMASCNGAATQQWEYDDATKKVKNVGSQTCMWIPSHSDKNNRYYNQKIYLIHCDGNPNWDAAQMQFTLNGNRFASEYAGTSYCGWSKSVRKAAGYPLKLSECNGIKSNKILDFEE